MNRIPRRLSHIHCQDRTDHLRNLGRTLFGNQKLPHQGIHRRGSIQALPIQESLNPAEIQALHSRGPPHKWAAHPTAHIQGTQGTRTARALHNQGLLHILAVQAAQIPHNQDPPRKWAVRLGLHIQGSLGTLADLEILRNQGLLHMPVVQAARNQGSR